MLLKTCNFHFLYYSLDVVWECQAVGITTVRWVQCYWLQYFIFLVDDTYDLDSFRTYKAKRFVPANLLGSLLRLADNNMTDNMAATYSISNPQFVDGYQKHTYE